MKYLLLLSLLLVGCSQQHRWVGSTEITASGYPVYHRDMVVQPFICQRHNMYDNGCNISCMCQCEHVRVPLMYQEYVPPLYKPVFCGVDSQGHLFYNNMIIRPGYWQEVFMGYYCAKCGRRL
jgi:hypothetical protein